MIEIDLDKISKNELTTILIQKDKEIERLHSIIKDKKERQDIAIRLLHKLFGTNDYEINYIMGILNGDRKVWTFEKMQKELEKGSEQE